MINRRRLAGFGAATVFALLAGCTGCTGGAGSQDNGTAGDFSGEVKGDITVLTNRTDLVDTTLADYAKAFEAAHPGTDVTFEGVTNYEEDVTTQLGSGDYGDVLLIPNVVALDQYPQFFEPLGTTAELKAEYRFVDQGVHQGRGYGLSLGGIAKGFVVNKRIWAQAGITAPPKTPEDFLAGLQAIADKTDAVPYYTNYKDGWPLSEWNSHRAVLADPRINDEFPADAEPWQPGGIQYVTDSLLFDIVNRKLTEKDPLTTNWEGSKPMLGTGRIAAMLLGSWAVPQVQEAAKAAGANPGDIAFWPFPYQNGGKFHAAIDGDKLAAVSRNSTNKATAHAFLTWFVTESGFAAGQQAIPPAIDQELPQSLQDFTATGVELVEVPPATTNAGKEDQIIKESEIDLKGDIYRQKLVDIARGAADGTKESYFADLNKRWSAAQARVMK
ncbi:ABC transporter substrate-binding protein [Actinoplanes derwentensis]|uniref:ABC-type glycerol-3-phosphate transport system, substrate-binding protein n=1 Tax=Actinoplanes derwentensis TaxID=113562 RepID=A0A1H1XB31_9ACTN|nr:ABC transporter substrate-binding protein [Actinoplanes derwentensis]GID89625.1 sugar ABC transporter substrate-binding protein [Actinoplanes derwentensis]SDT06402.1 ABC-type glycerol-3-phosphate transport system, substrate-binding protein [Actinoplanes derwentensis]